MICKISLPFTLFMPRFSRLATRFVHNGERTAIANRESIEKWRKRNLYYYQDLENIYKFFVQPESDVLEIGCGLGYLLNAVNPQSGLGIDIDPQVIEIAREKFLDLNFSVAQAEAFSHEKHFDYILLDNTISSLKNIQKTFSNIHQVCKPSTKIILTFHNPAWEIILKLATFLGQRKPIKNANWLSYEDVKNLLILEGFEVVFHGKQMLLPRRIPLLFWLFNKILAPLPIINHLCLTEYIIARIQPPSFPGEQNFHNLTCSVIIPARNEAGNIESCITRMPALGKHTEIIFVEGHSTDNTWEEIQRVQAKYSQEWDIKICQQKGQGKGNAVREGFAMATGDILIILDSDLTVIPEDLIYFFQAVASGRCELANGCRLIYPLSNQAMPWLNRIANRFFAWLLSYLLNTKIKDSLCGTKALSKENYQRIAANRSYFGDFDPFGDFDLLFGAAKLGLQIKDIPVKYFPRTYGRSNIHHFKEGLVLLKMCLYAAKKIKFR
ncbi:glycosyltransferase [Gloeothece verrucosa]|uniref:Glycosyl transferase family 2 n=1 Tax=Gloeothece verrucosa (strain PCC 7822) TaxID=497965 RepID=E0UI62_GLOV7|nr:glycosyltransferase [Gloeothece verrucosa]ADN15714.1 glycosyl transferase family 2 [Gloeothece verrucosa PCC 7822]